MRKKYSIKLKNRDLELGTKTILMGILNVTPDSFSEGGKFAKKEKAVARAFEMIEEGVDIIDIGGESTRPGAEEVSEEEELQRVIPVIEEIRSKSDVPISIDTYKARVAAESIFAGADIINDISGCRFDKEMATIAANSNTPVILMHIKGTPKNMQEKPIYTDLMGEIKEYLRDSIGLLLKVGLPKEQIIIDPGIGFGKTTEHNLEIMNRLAELSDLDRPILIGPSRKSVIGNILDLPVEDRLIGTAAAVAAGIAKGAHIVRVHDVTEMKQVVKVVDSIINEGRVHS